jgi:ion channel-forming bestrophin family protein
MINYNPKNWFNLIFSLNKSDTIRILWKQLIFISLLATLIIMLLHLLPKAHQDQLSDYTKELTAIYSLIGFVMSLLLLFRTNGAYDRWWEGRKLWGAIVNDCRSGFLKITIRISSEEDKKEFERLFNLYIYNAKNNLRANKNSLVFQKYENPSKDNSPVLVMKLIYIKLRALEKQGELSQGDLIQIDVNLNGLIASLGGCQRIKNTPIPFSYSIFIKKFIFLYVITLPIVFFHFDYWAVLITAFVFYAFVSMEVLAEEIEDPFGTDANDLPLDQICQTIKQDLNNIIEN